MSDILELINSMQGECSCGRSHYTSVKDIRIGSGLVNSVGQILRENGFPEKILLVADQNTLKAAHGIEKSLDGFDVQYKIYDELRVAQVKHAEQIEELIKNGDIGVLSVGTGSVNDICRLAAARQNKMLCIFATAPSMDGFASYSSPLVHNGFKMSYPAESPRVIIGDTRILANAPVELKSAGFGDMVAKHVGLIDWQVSSLLTNEPYCEKIAHLTKSAVDELMKMADRVTQNDEHTAGKIFEALLKTGIGMSFMQNSRPASGAEHIVSHLIECIELKKGIIPNLHGDDVGVCTLEVLKHYEKLSRLKSIKAKKECVNWDDVYEYYGDMAENVKEVNHPENIVDCVSTEHLMQVWGQITDIIKSFPSYEECKRAMIKAGCKITVSDIGKSPELFYSCMKYSPYMRKRLTLLRLNNMILTESR